MMLPLVLAALIGFAAHKDHYCQTQNLQKWLCPSCSLHPRRPNSAAPSAGGPHRICCSQGPLRPGGKH
eukprot:1159660-Pelagomonas_calceolata.AAC.9